MKKKILSLSTVPILGISILMTQGIFVNKKDNNIINNINLSKQYNNYFFNFIKDSAKNNIPNIIFARDATLPIQQFFYSVLGAYYYSIDSQGLFNTKNEFSWFYTAEETKSRFNINELLNISTIQNDLNNISHENLKPLNFIFRNNAAYDYFYSIINKNISMGFNYSDFILADADMHYLINSFLKGENNILEDIIKYANRILVVSDGAYHTKYYVPLLETIGNEIKIEPKSKIIHDLNMLKNNKIKLTKNLLVNLLSLKNFEISNPNSNFDFISHINYDSYKNTINPYWNIYTFNTSFYSYAESLLKKQENIDLFLNTFSNLFLFNINDMSDIMINGYESYDKNKRNAIFLGSSLFSKSNNSQFTRLQDFPNLTHAIRLQMDEFIKKFPPSEYNIIFKLHPVYKQNEAIQYIKYITNNQISDPIIINPKIPLEVLIANDYYLYMQNNNNYDKLYNFIFRNDNNYQAKEWTTFFGLQPSTTTIHTTRIFYENSFNIDKNESAKLIPMSNFPIPILYSTLYKPTTDNYHYNYYNDNINILNDIYKYYNPSIYYNDDAYKNLDNFVMNDITSGINILSFNSLYVWLPIILLLIFVFTIFLLIIIRKNNQKNLIKSYRRIKGMKL